MRQQISARLVVVCAASLLALATTAAQTPQDGSQTRPVFRAGATLVPVDVRVIDKAGKPITDLTQNDFVVSEDGVRQDVRFFFPQALTAQPAATVAPLARRANQVTDIAPQQHRVFLILMGRGNLTGPASGIEGVLHLVRDRLLPQDRVAVLAWNRATDFTTDHDRVIAVLERLRREQLGIDERLKRYQTGLVWLYGDREIPKFLQREIDAVFGGGVDQQVRTVHEALIRQSGAMQDDLQRQVDLFQTPGSDLIGQAQLRDLGLSFDEFTAQAAQTIGDVTNLYASIEYLRQIDGEKHLVWLQDTGVVPARAEHDRDLARTASDARVVLSIIRAGGTEFYGAGLAEQRAMPVSNARIAMGTLGKSMVSRTLAEMTGGRYDANRFSNASISADYIEQASRFQYLLGYYPANANWDGRFRNIKVEITRPGATVLYRHGYFARQELTPFDRRGALSLSRIAAAAEYAKEIPDIGLKAAAMMAGAVGSREVRLDITIDLSRVQFELRNGSQTTTIELAAFCLDDRQRPVGEVWRKIELSIPEARLAELRQQGTRVTLTVPVTTPAASVKLVAYDYVADLIGSVNMNVKR